jgi:hypothetical protein
MKGASADREVAEHAASVRRSGADEISIVRCGVGVLAEPTTIIDVRRTPDRSVKDDRRT